MFGREEGIGFITEEEYSIINNQSIRTLIVGREVIVPVMNMANPYRDEIYRKGISQLGLAGILNSTVKPGWGVLLGNSKNTPDIPLSLFSVNDPAINSAVANFANTDRLNLVGHRVENGQELISAIQKDPNALGFCRLVQIIDKNTRGIVGNISLIPIDKNGNGKIDYMESIYDNLQDFSRGVWIGKYPKTLYSNIYSVSGEKAISGAGSAFLKWVLTDGQQFLSGDGYSDLALSERKSQLDKIIGPAISLPAPSATYAFLKILLIILFVVALAGLLMDTVVRSIKGRKRAVAVGSELLLPVFDVNSVIVPKGVFFDKTHTWAYMKKDGKVKIGIDDFLQRITGKLTRIEMKNAGTRIKKGEPLLTIIRKGKKLNIMAPISGTITAQNEALVSNSSLINAAPYREGWVYEIDPANWLLEIQFFTMADNYKIWLKDEFLRLRDFLSTAAKAHSPDYALVTLQDGGALTENILADLGPEIWDDFQTKFIDTTK
jgi:glycine cleavage system H lipoate-binding protein